MLVEMSLSVAIYQHIWGKTIILQSFRHYKRLNTYALAS